MSRNHLKYGISKISQNTEKSPADLRSLPVTQTPPRNHWLTLVWKTIKINNITIILIIFFSKWLNTLNDTAFLGQGGRRSNTNERTAHILRTLRLELHHQIPYIGHYQVYLDVTSHIYLCSLLLSVRQLVSFCICSYLYGQITRSYGRWPYCNRYHRRKWTRRHEFQSKTRLVAFHIPLIPLGKVWIQLFSLQLWVYSRTDWVHQPWWAN